MAWQCNAKKVYRQPYRKLPQLKDEFWKDVKIPGDINEIRTPN